MLEQLSILLVKCGIKAIYINSQDSQGSQCLRVAEKEKRIILTRENASDMVSFNIIKREVNKKSMTHVFGGLNIILNTFLAKLNIPTFLTKLNIFFSNTYLLIFTPCTCTLHKR